MPPVSHSPTGTTSQGSILLIEEYDALAAAISSALRKFAPEHEVHVASTLNEAKALAKKIEPDLLVIDFDPAFPGLSAFLQKLQETQPDTRALLLAGKLPPELAKATRAASALQFVEKPFDVPDFGAAVQALLGPWRESETAASRGTLQDLTLADLLVVQCAGGRTVVVEVTNDNGKSGEIHLRQGTPSHAEAGRKSGNEAIREMLDWSDVEVREREKPRSTRQTVQAGWPAVLVETLQKVKPHPARPTRKTTPAPPPKAAKKLVVVDDTEMLLIFVEDVLMTSSRDFQISTATSGISGVKEVERVKPDLVLLDYSLPDINGDEVCRRLLQNDATSRIPVLMMSGHVPEMAKAAATLDNVVATIAKPFLSDALVSLVQQTLTEGRAVRKKSAAARKAVSAPAPKTPPLPVEPPITAEAKAAVPPGPPPPPEPIGREEAPRIEPLPPPFPPQPPSSDRTEKEPALRPPETFLDEHISTRVLSEGPNEVVLSLFLEVVSVQLTPELRMGSIRAKPSSGEVSLHIVSPGVRAKLPQTGFTLGQVGLDGKGRIATLRLIPSRLPVRAAPTQNALQIGGVSVVPIDSTSRMQLTPTAGAPMTLQMLAHLELAGVELSPTFQVSQIVLRDHGHPIRVTMNSQTSGHEETGTACETIAVRLDHSAQIKELLLNPVR